MRLLPRSELTATKTDVLIVDASTILRALLPSGDASVSERLSSERDVHAPYLIDLEITSALRRLCHHERLSADRASDALHDFMDLNIRRYPHEPLLPRVWGLRENLTTYDAVYVALAEALDAPLLTADRGLARAPGNGAIIELVPGA